MKNFFLPTLIFTLTAILIACDKPQAPAPQPAPAPIEKPVISEELVTAAKAGNIETVKQLLNSGIPAKAQNAQGETALSSAASTGQAAISYALLSAGAEVDGNGDAYSPLSTTITTVQDTQQSRYLDTIMAILSAGANPNKIEKDGQTPLTLAVSGAADPKMRDFNKEVIKLLLQAKADANIGGINGGNTPLLLAISAGDKEIVGLLLQGGANPNIKDSVGVSALEKAKEKGNREVVDMLVKAGAIPS